MNDVVFGASSLGHVPQSARWEFDEGVVRVFPDMLQRSIPQYEVMRRCVYELGRRFVVPDTCIIDLGCSLGDSLAPFIDRFGTANTYLGIEVSAPMIAAFRARFAAEIGRGIVAVRDIDLRHNYPQAVSSLTLCILTLQFIPVEYRRRLIARAYENMQPGGAFILVEKLLGSANKTHELITDIYYEFKSANGYSSAEIDAKRASLEHVLVPLSSRWNEQLLYEAGFGEVECFWRWMNFAGYIAIKS